MAAHGIGSKLLANHMASSKNNAWVTPRAFRRPCVEGKGGSGLDGVPPAQATLIQSRGISPVPPQTGGSCQRSEGTILLSVAAPGRMELMGLKCIKADFG